MPPTERASGAEPLIPDPGTVLSDRYEVVRELGRGGMGVVLLAQDLMLEKRHVALKLPLPILAQDHDAVSEVQREALVAMRLSHPHIVTVRAFEMSESGPILVMDYTPGPTFQEYLARRGQLTDKKVQVMFRPLAGAIDYAHTQGVIHRDLKPSNFILNEDGRPQVTDFGIASVLRKSLTRITGRSSPGTLAYASPEQVRGADPTPAQDVYSLAASMYECLAGRPPFHRGDIAWQIVNEPPSPLPDSDAPLHRSIALGLSKEEAKRPASCRDLVRAASPESSSRAADPATRGGDGARGSAGGRKSWAVGLILVALVVATYFLGSRDSRRHRASLAEQVASIPADAIRAEPLAFLDRCMMSLNTQGSELRKAISQGERRIKQAEIPAGVDRAVIASKERRLETLEMLLEEADAWPTPLHGELLAEEDVLGQVSELHKDLHSLRNRRDDCEARLLILREEVARLTDLRTVVQDLIPDVRERREACRAIPRDKGLANEDLEELISVQGRVVTALRRGQPD